MAERCASVVIMGWESMECVLHGESSHARCINATRTGFEDIMAQAMACKIVVRMSTGSYSGLARHKIV